MWRSSNLLMLVVAGTLGGGLACQSILGFEDFERASGGGAAGASGADASGVRSGGASSDGHAGASGDQGGGGAAEAGSSGTAGTVTGGAAGGDSEQGGGGAGSASGDAGLGGAQGGASGASSGGEGSDTGGGGDSPATAAEGDPCAAAGDCLSGLVCLYGRCRPPCSDDTACPQSSVCLSVDTAGGCRLPAEASCSNGGCDNAQLVCGLDETCRAPCSASDSCGGSTQRCVAGTCVSTVGQNASLFDCGGLAEGSVACASSALRVCNVLGPGMAEVEVCSSAGICDASIPESGTYDPDQPPRCQGGCGAGRSYCDGSVLLLCKDDGSGPVDAGESCATSELCASTVEQALAVCVEPECDQGEVRCSGGSTKLVGERCNAGRTAFQAIALCDDDGFQCNPTTGDCVSIAIDATEVSQGEYLAWLDTVPDTSSQPAGCEWNGSFDSDESCMLDATCAGAAVDCPAVCVDWCDARAYCEAQGRRLCGRIGGGMVSFDGFGDPGQSEWTNACSAAGQFIYSHGDTVPETDPDECVYNGNSGGSAYPVGSRSACHSPGLGYQTLYDLSGNVAEWEDSCELSATANTAGAEDACRVRGGSYESVAAELRCTASPTIPLRRSAVAPTVGFRCCG